MSIARLSLNNFRNHKSLALEVASDFVVLFGPNGCGKTNILEAISLFTPGRGLRGARLGEITSSHNPVHNNQFSTSSNGGLLWSASLHMGDETHMSTGLEQTINGSERRLFKLDYHPVKNVSAFVEVLSIIWLTPETDRLFLESPALRRKFIDRLLFAVDPLHGERMLRYERALKERLAVLKTAKDSAWLDALEEQLATLGTTIAFARLQLMKELNKFGQESASLKEEQQGLNNHHPFQPLPSFFCEMLGDIDKLVQSNPATFVEDYAKETLKSNRTNDLESGGTRFGIHRSDWQVTYLKKNITADLCSTGEQKILLIAVIIAFIKRTLYFDERLTVLLLDDIAAHLDEKHRGILFDHLQQLRILSGFRLQSWLTGTDPHLFESLADSAQFFNVEGL